MATKRVATQAAFLAITGIALTNCQSTKPPPTEQELFPSHKYDMQVTGQTFVLDLPWNQQQELSQQQDAAFALANAHDANHATHQYVKIERLPDEDSRYILKSGVRISSPEHEYDTFLQYTLETSCEHQQNKLHCQYKAVEGVYSVDLPETMSLKSDQTQAQMEQNEITTLSKVNINPLTFTDTFKTSFSLVQLKSKLKKKHFLVETKNSSLYLIRPHLNYEVELSQEKIKKQYVITASFMINPIKSDAYSADYLTSVNNAKKDLKTAVND